MKLSMYKLPPSVMPTLQPLKLFRYDRLCGLVVRVPGYRSRGPGFNSVAHLRQLPDSAIRIISIRTSFTLYCDITPESRNNPLLGNGSLTRVLWKFGFVETDLVRNALSMSTESTNMFHGYPQTTNIFHGYELDYIQGAVQGRTIHSQDSRRSRKSQQRK
jgi:hypothetical protein